MAGMRCCSTGRLFGWFGYINFVACIDAVRECVYECDAGRAKTW